MGWFFFSDAYELIIKNGRGIHKSPGSYSTQWMEKGLYFKKRLRFARQSVKIRPV